MVTIPILNAPSWVPQKEADFSTLGDLGNVYKQAMADVETPELARKARDAVLGTTTPDQQGGFLSGLQRLLGIQPQQAQPAAQPATPASIQPGQYAAAPSYIQWALDRHIQDPERRAYLGALAAKEAAGPNEVSDTGASGPFQFTRGTGTQYGLFPNGKDMRQNIELSVIAANKLTDDNVAYLTRALGRQPTPGEMALAHQQGAETAANMLLGRGNASASNLTANRISPNLGPQAAAQKIMDYYGMPAAGSSAAAGTPSFAGVEVGPNGRVAPSPQGSPAPISPQEARQRGYDPTGARLATPPAPPPQPPPWTPPGNQVAATGYLGAPVGNPSLMAIQAAQQAAQQPGAPAPAGAATAGMAFGQSPAMPPSVANAQAQAAPDEGDDEEETPPSATPTAGQAAVPAPAAAPASVSNALASSLAQPNRGQAMLSRMSSQDFGQLYANPNTRALAQGMLNQAVAGVGKNVEVVKTDSGVYLVDKDNPERSRKLFDSDSEDKGGLNPVWMQDDQGNWVPGQMTKSGKLRQMQIEGGFRPAPPQEIAGAKTEAMTLGKATAVARAALPRIVDNVGNSIKLLDSLQNPQTEEEKSGKYYGTGRYAGLPDWAVAGTSVADFRNKLAQVKGQSFLQAYDTLRGAGQITDIEGAKGTAAINRLNAATSEKEFNAAINDAKDVLRQGLERAKRAARGDYSSHPDELKQFQGAQPTSTQPAGARQPLGDIFRVRR